MTNLDALKSLYAAIGGDPADVAALNSNTDVLNAIAAFYGAAESAASNAAALMAIAENYTASEPVLESLTVTANGDYTPDEGVDGFSSVSVEVEPAPVTIPVYTKIVKNDPVYLADLTALPGAALSATPIGSADFSAYTIAPDGFNFQNATFDDNVPLNWAAVDVVDGFITLTGYMPSTIPAGYTCILIELTAL